jgi:hypothetical protein
MTRTRIQLPDELYQRAKRFAAARELSLAEMTRRGLELFLARYPEPSAPKAEWTLPEVRGGGLKVPLSRLREIAADDESTRGLRR